MLADIATGVVDAVVVYDLDRLHRQPRELEEFFDICDERRGHRPRLRHRRRRPRPPTTGDSWRGSRAPSPRKESDDKSRRIKRKAWSLLRTASSAAAARGRSASRTTARRSAPSEAAVVAEAARRVLAGEAVRSVCFDFNERGIKTVTGKRVGAAGADADAQVGPDQRPARAQGRDRRRRRVARDHRASRTATGSGRSSRTRPGARTTGRAATCSPGCSAAGVAASLWSPVPATTDGGATSALGAPTPMPAARWPSSPTSLRS